VLTAGGASLLIFSVLATVDFPGFAELGVVAAMGVLMILISTWMVQPALYALLPPKLREINSLAAPPAFTRTGKYSGAFPKPIAVALVILAIGGAVFGGLKGFTIYFDYDVLAMLPKDSQAAYYQRRLVAESDYQSEVIIFTAKDMAEARRITNEADKLKTIAQAQSLTGLFPEDADERLHKAVSIGKAFARTDYGPQVEELDRVGLTSKSFELLKAVLEKSTAIIDEAQEQAFSAGHANLVESMEKVREQVLAISASLAADGELGRVRSESFLRALLSGASVGLNIIDAWRQAQPLAPEQLPPALRDRFFGADGSIAVYAFPAKSVYDPANLDALIKDVYNVSPEVTGFPTTHQAFSKAVVASFTHGTQLALALCLLWVMAATRSLRGFALAALPLLIGGGWMLGLMALNGIRYNYANIVALPLVIAMAVDYGVWFSYRWSELNMRTPLQVSLVVGKTIGLAAGTSLAGLGAITLASYRGVSSLGLAITLGLLCCLSATLVVAPAIGQLLDSRRNL
jgi:predicted RND superfamily exporter protein